MGFLIWLVDSRFEGLFSVLSMCKGLVDVRIDSFNL